MAPQQSRLVAIAPETQNVSLSLNASAIYAGAAIGSAAGAAVLGRFGFSALGLAAGFAALGVLAHIIFSEWLVRRSGRNAALNAAG